MTMHCQRLFLTLYHGTHGPETFQTLFLQHRAGWKSFHWRIGPKISLFQSFETQRRTPTSRPPAQGWHEIRRSFKASLQTTVDQPINLTNKHMICRICILQSISPCCSAQVCTSNHDIYTNNHDMYMYHIYIYIYTLAMQYN